jgi:hypothetical protein
MRVDILAPPDTVDIYGNICSGGFFVWRLDTFSLPGTYLINQPFIGNCDSVFRINIELVELQARITGPDTLDCGNPSILLDGSQSDTVSQTNFSWSLDGIVIDPGQIESNVIVDRGGQLQLIISANGCADTASVFIHTDTVKPIVNLILDTFGCQKDSVWIRSVYSGAIINYNWSGPGLEEQFQDSALITTPGNYSYTVEGSNGCDTTVNFEIIEDYRFPDFELSLDTLTCNSDTIIPNIINRIPGTSFNWAGPQGFNFNGIDPKITLAGIYTLSAISPSGCRSDTSFMVFADFQEPRFSLFEDTLSCQPDSIQLEVSPYDPTLLYQWTGPSGFFSTEGLPFVRIEGQYILTVTGKNGCIAMDTVVISKTDAVPDIEYETVNIDCLNSTGSIRAQSPTGIFFSWQGPNGFSSSESEISGLEAGVYYLTVSDASGCENTRIIEIKESTVPPEVTLSGDTINCNSPIVTLSFVSADSIASFFWVAPDNSTYRDSSLSVSLPGQYIFLGRGSNGCVVEDTIIVEIDTLTPLGQILPVNITCENDSVWLKLNDYSMAQVVKWLFPNNVEIFLDSVPTRSGGEYIVQLTGSNGCISQDTLFVNVDTVPPILVTAAGEINCNSRQTEITVQPNSDVRSWTISGPAGNVSDQLKWSIGEPGDYTVQWVGVN